MVSPLLREMHRLLTPLLDGRNNIMPDRANPDQKLFISATASELTALVDFYQELGRMINTNGKTKLSTRRSARKPAPNSKGPGRSGMDGSQSA